MSFLEFDNTSINGAAFLAVLLLETGHDAFGGFRRVALQNFATFKVVENFEGDFVVFLVVRAPVEDTLAGLERASDFN